MARDHHAHANAPPRPSPSALIHARLSKSVQNLVPFTSLSNRVALGRTSLAPAGALRASAGRARFDAPLDNSRSYNFSVRATALAENSARTRSRPRPPISLARRGFCEPARRASPSPRLADGDDIAFSPRHGLARAAHIRAPRSAPRPLLAIAFEKPSPLVELRPATSETESISPTRRKARERKCLRPAPNSAACAPRFRPAHPRRAHEAASGISRARAGRAQEVL